MSTYIVTGYFNKIQKCNIITCRYLCIIPEAVLSGRYSVCEPDFILTGTVTPLSSRSVTQYISLEWLGASIGKRGSINDVFLDPWSIKGMAIKTKQLLSMNSQLKYAPCNTITKKLNSMKSMHCSQIIPYLFCQISFPIHGVTHYSYQQMS